MTRPVASPPLPSPLPSYFSAFAARIPSLTYQVKVIAVVIGLIAVSERRRRRHRRHAREREREKKREKIKKHHNLIHIKFIHLVNAHVFLHAHHRGPMRLATTFYFVCTYGEWHEQAKF